MEYKCEKCNADLGTSPDDIKEHSCFDGVVQVNISADGIASIHDESTSAQLNLQWSSEDTLRLIKLWSETNESYASNRKCEMWSQMAVELTTPAFCPNAAQVENKWKGLRRTHRKTTESGRDKWKYLEAMDEATIKHPSLKSSNNTSSANFKLEVVEMRPDIIEYSDEEQAIGGPVRSKRASNRHPPWLRIFEKNTERRHRERMDMQKRMCDLLEQLANK